MLPAFDRLTPLNATCPLVAELAPFRIRATKLVPLVTVYCEPVNAVNPDDEPVVPAGTNAPNDTVDSNEPALLNSPNRISIGAAAEVDTRLVYWVNPDKFTRLPGTT